MSYKLKNIEDIKKFSENNKKLIIIGTGWIGKLMYYGLFELGIPKEQIEVARGKDESSLKWPIAIKDLNCELLNDNNACLIVSDKEKKAKAFAEKIDCNGLNNIYYISENFKNQLDEFLMKANPAEYEKQVLVSRKEDLDLGNDVYVKSYINGLISKSDSEIPMFQSLEIETVNRCNGTCEFCPVNRKDDPRVLKMMSIELFEKIIEELVKLSFDGRVNLFSNNEPLIDNRIIKLAKYTKDRLPNAQTFLFTNGTLLKPDTFNELIKYIDTMCIDLYYDKDAKMEIPDDLYKVLENAIEDENVRNKTMVQVICRSAIRNNRGGQSKNRNVKYKVKSGCMLPYVQMIIRPDGKVSLCCNDPIGKITLGDVSENTLMEIWNSQKYNDIRKAICETRQNFDFCKECDNFASMDNHGKELFSKEQIDAGWEQVRGIILKNK